MIKFIVVLFFLFSGNCFANTFEVYGEWIIDRERTLNFNMKNIKFSSTRLALIDCSIENSTLSFFKNKGSFIMTDHNCEHEGKRAFIKGIVDKFNYSLLYEDDKQTVLKLEGENNEYHVDVLNWIDVSSFWINQGDDEEVFRYFYKRK